MRTFIHIRSRRECALSVHVKVCIPRATRYIYIYRVFTARPEAQRCQVTPYVVNVAAAAAAGEGSDS